MNTTTTTTTANYTNTPMLVLEKIEEEGRTRLRRSSIFDGEHAIDWEEIGGQLNRVIILNSQNSNGAPRRWWTVGLTLAIGFFSIYAIGVACVISSLALVPQPNTEKLYQELDLEEKYTDAVKNTIPFIQKWFRGTNHQLFHQEFHDNVASSTCVDYFVDQFEEKLAFTNPKYVRLALGNFGSALSTNPLILEALEDILHEPQDLTSFYAEVRGCASASPSFAAIACALQENLRFDLDETKMKILYEYATNLAVILDRLTLKMEESASLLYVAVDAMQNSRRREFEIIIEKRYSGAKDRLTFELDKYYSVAGVLTWLAKGIAENTPAKKNLKYALALNILEAVKLDIANGHEMNARTGLALAVSGIQYDPFVRENRYRWELGKHWVDGYIAWNLGFVASSITASKSVKLFIPSVLCSAVSDPGIFIQRRSISLALGSMHHFEVPDDTNSDLGLSAEKLEILYQDELEQQLDDISVQRFFLAESIGFSIQGHVKLTVPDNDAVERMFYNVCAERCHDPALSSTDTNPISAMDPEYFNIYVGFIIWLTVVLSGSGLEIFFVVYVIHNGWNKNFEASWRLAQMMFPVLAVTTLGCAVHQNYLALPILLIGLWKFGFPEKYCSMYVAIYDKTQSKAARLSHAINAFGLSAHHSAASLLICMLLVGVAKPEQSVFDCILILCIQHLFVMLRYFHTKVYIVIETVLEAWFEWSVLSNYESFLNNHWTVALAASVMLFAHWLYFAAGMLSLVGTPPESVSKNSSKLDEETEGIDSMLRSFQDLVRRRKKVTGAPASYEAKEEFDA